MLKISIYAERRVRQETGWLAGGPLLLVATIRHTTDTYYRHTLQTHTTDTYYRHTLQTHTADTHYRHILQTHTTDTLQTHTTDTHYRHIPLPFSHNERTPVQI